MAVRELPRDVMEHTVPKSLEADAPESVDGRAGTSDSDPHYVIISGYHDYRSKRRANLHFIADELAKPGDVFFFSLRYSYLTRRREDPRHDLWALANPMEGVNGVDCYLWRTPIHPFRMPPRLRLAERSLFGLFARHLPRPARARITAATHIFVESGIRGRLSDHCRSSDRLRKSWHQMTGW